MTDDGYRISDGDREIEWLRGVIIDRECGYRMTEGGGPEGASCPMHCSVFSRHKIKVKEGDDAAVFVSPVSKPQRSGPC